MRDNENENENENIEQGESIQDKPLQDKPLQDEPPGEEQETLPSLITDAGALPDTDTGVAQAEAPAVVSPAVNPDRVNADDVWNRWIEDIKEKQAFLVANAEKPLAIIPAYPAATANTPKKKANGKSSQDKSSQDKSSQDKHPNKEADEQPDYDALESARLKAIRNLYTINYPQLKRRCLMSFEDYAKEWAAKGAEVVSTPQGRYIWYRAPGDGPRILAVAHLDCYFPAMDHFYVLRFKTQHYLNNPTGAPDYRWRVMVAQLDDRLGAYLICDKLPEIGIVTDILLTEGEESGKSTAGVFEPGETAKLYQWMVEFDRTGIDVVGYQFSTTPEWKRIGKALKFDASHGSFSDIASLGRLGILGWNFGVGYHDYHSWDAYAWVDEIQLGLHNFLKLWTWMKDKHLPFDGAASGNFGYGYTPARGTTWVSPGYQRGGYRQPANDDYEYDGWAEYRADRSLSNGKSPQPSPKYVRYGRLGDGAYGRWDYTLKQAVFEYADGSMISQTTGKTWDKDYHQTSEGRPASEDETENAKPDVDTSAAETQTKTPVTRLGVISLSRMLAEDEELLVAMKLKISEAKGNKDVNNDVVLTMIREHDSIAERVAWTKKRIHAEAKAARKQTNGSAIGESSRNRSQGSILKQLTALGQGAKRTGQGEPTIIGKGCAHCGYRGENKYERRFIRRNGKCWDCAHDARSWGPRGIATDTDTDPGAGTEGGL